MNGTGPAIGHFSDTTHWVKHQVMKASALRPCGKVFSSHRRSRILQFSSSCERPHATQRTEGQAEAMKDWVVDPEQDVMGESFQSLGWEKKIRLVGTTKQKVGDIMIPGYPLFSTIFEVASAIPMRKLHHAVLLRPCGWISDSHRSCSNTPIGVIMHS